MDGWWGEPEEEEDDDELLELYDQAHEAFGPMSSQEVDYDDPEDVIAYVEQDPEYGPPSDDEEIIPYATRQSPMIPVAWEPPTAEELEDTRFMNRQHRMHGDFMHFGDIRPSQGWQDMFFQNMRMMRRTQLSLHNTEAAWREFLAANEQHGGPPADVIPPQWMLDPPSLPWLYVSLVANGAHHDDVEALVRAHIWPAEQEWVGSGVYEEQWLELAWSGVLEQIDEMYAQHADQIVNGDFLFPGYQRPENAPEDECPICYERPCSVRNACNHWLCQVCSDHPTLHACPMCRAVWAPPPIVPAPLAPVMREEFPYTPADQWGFHTRHRGWYDMYRDDNDEMMQDWVYDMDRSRLNLNRRRRNDLRALRRAYLGDVYTSPNTVVQDQDPYQDLDDEDDPGEEYIEEVD